VLCLRGWQTVGRAPDENRFYTVRPSETGVLLAQDGVTPALAEKSVTASTLEAKSATNPV
jgi:hypothetical protein